MVANAGHREGRRTGSIVRDLHQPRTRPIRRNVEPGLVRFRPQLTVSGDIRIDQTRIKHVAAVLNRLGGAHIATIPKAKRFADRQAQSLIVFSLLLIDLSLRRLLSRSRIASQRIPEMTTTGSESLGGLHTSPPGTSVGLAIQTIDRENDPSGLEISFGPFRLLRARRLLLRGNEPVSVSGRTFDLLIALVERPGEVVSKSELIAKVWPQTFVADGNLKVRIAALRRALADGQAGDRYISTIVGRGYCFVAPVTRSSRRDSASRRCRGARVRGARRNRPRRLRLARCRCVYRSRHLPEA
jgi:DNA-binding winged helix-turn-helix (wHTH) protein